MRAAVERVDAELTRCAEGAPNPTAVRETLRRQFAVAALAGAKWPDPATVVEAERAAEAHEAKVEALTAARGDIAEDLAEAVHSLSDRLIVENLRPAFEVTVDQIRTVADALPADLSADALLRSPDKVRKAWLGLDETIGRLTRLREQAEHLRRLRPAQLDESGECRTFRNLRAVWAEYQPGRTPPWSGLTPREAVLWQVRAGLEPWLPTGEEQDARFEEIHAAGLAGMQRQRHARAAVSAWGG